MNKIRYYFHLWVKLTENSFISVLTTRFTAILFLVGKLLRFVFFIIFLLTLFGSTRSIGGYSVTQALFFYMTFTIVDTVTQLFFREVYRFRPMVVSGDFDLILTKPMNPLFRALAGGADPLDLIMLIPYSTVLITVGIRLTAAFDIWRWIVYTLFLFNAFVLAVGFHILVLSLAILTTEIDHTVMIYRDLTSMGRIPVDIYREPLRSVLTFVVPVALMMTYPAKAFMGLLTWQSVLIAFAGSGVFLLFCIRIWKFALKEYSSASS